MDQGLFILSLKDHKDTTLNVMCSITSRRSGKKSRANRLSLRDRWKSSSKLDISGGFLNITIDVITPRKTSTSHVACFNHGKR